MNRIIAAEYFQKLEGIFLFGFGKKKNANRRFGKESWGLGKRERTFPPKGFSLFPISRTVPFFLILLTLTALPAGEWFGMRGNSPFKVRYQIIYHNGGTAVNSAVLRGRFNGKMLKNTLQSRHNNSTIRLLAVEQGKSVRVQVKYQFRNKNSRGAWSNASASLPDALTVEMAENQLKLRHIGCEIKINSLRH